MPISVFPNPIQVVSGDVSVTTAPPDLPVKVDGSGVTQPVAVVADPTQPVPVSGSTLDDIVAVGGIPITPGQGVPVSIQGTLPVALAPGVSSVSVSALPTGPALVASALPVTLAVDQQPVAVAVVQPVVVTADPTQPLPVSGSNVEDIIAVGGVPIIPGQGVPVSVQGTVPVSLPPLVPVSDPALAALGSQADPAAYTVGASSLVAQIKGLNDITQTLVVIATQQLQLLQAVLQALNSVAGQLGAAPASTNSAASTILN